MKEYGNTMMTIKVAEVIATMDCKMADPLYSAEPAQPESICSITNVSATSQTA